MTQEVVRQDVIQVIFDVDDSPLSKIQSEVNKTRSVIGSALGDNTFDDFKKSTTRATDGLDNIKDAAIDVKSANPFDDMADDAIDAASGLNKVKNNAAQLKSPFDKAAKGAEGLNDPIVKSESNSQALKTKLKVLGSMTFKGTISGLKQIGSKLTDIGEKAATAAFNGLKKVAGISFKALTTGVTAATAAVGTMVVKAVSAYADTEQLRGGVETLFGAGGKSLEEYAASVGKSTDAVKADYEKLLSAQADVFSAANDAYKTAGMSANEYMETVTGFSASLVASLNGDTKAAAKLSKMAITDMADNANKMGTPIENIQNAYQGFAKQNYTMLDNLKLGYGGTKTEMERLIKDAAKLDDTVDANSMSFANIVTAINVMQNKMGIAGTTAKEANKTISGSLNSMKSAWRNLFPALIAGGDEFDQCVDNLIDSAKTFGKNVIPAFKKGLTGAGTLLKEIVPIAVREIPPIVAEVMPELATAGAQIVVGFVNSMIDNAPLLWQAAQDLVVSVIKALYEGFTGQEMSDEAFAQLKAGVSEAFGAIKDIIVGVIQFGQQLWTFLAPILAWIGQLALTVFSWIGDNINWILPLVAALVAAFLIYKAALVVVNVISGIVAAGQAVMAAVCGTASATAAAGTAAVGASAGAAAPEILAFAAAILAVGVAILAICAGFYLLSQAAIALSQAGAGAIIVMVAMVAAIVGLAIGAAALGPALTVGAVGLLAFGACVLMVGAGFALLGAGALMAANALRIIVEILPAIIQYGAAGAANIALLGVSMLAFAAGAALAGAAALILGAGLLVCAAALLAIAVSFVIITAALALIALLSTALLLNFKLIGAAMLIVSQAALILSAALLPLTAVFAALTIPVGLFTLIITPLSLLFIALALSAVVFLASMTALAGIFTVVSVMSILFRAALTALPPLFGALTPQILSFSGALLPLAATLTAITIPITLFTALIALLAVGFSVLAVSSLVVLATFTGITAIIGTMVVMTMALNMAMVVMQAQFTAIGLSALSLTTNLLPLSAVFMALTVPTLALALAITPLALAFTLLAVSAVVFTVAITALTAILTITNVMFTMLMSLLMTVGVAMTLCASMAAILAAKFMILTPATLALTPAMLMLGVGLTPLAVTFTIVAAAALIYVAAMAALMAVMVILTPLTALFALSLAVIKTALATMVGKPAQVAAELLTLTGAFTAILLPTGLLLAALVPLVALFVTWTATGALLLVSMIGLLMTLTGITVTISVLTITARILVGIFNNLTPASLLLTKAFTVLLPVMSDMVKPLLLTSGEFAALSAALLIALVSVTGMTRGFVLLCALLTLTAKSMSKLKDESTKLANGLKSGYDKMINSTQRFQNSINNMSGSVKSIIRNLASDIFHSLDNVDLFDVGFYMMNGLINGMNSQRNAAVSTAASIANAINNEYRRIQQIGSPSKVWGSFGTWQDTGLVNEMRAGIPQVEQAAGDVAYAATPYAGDYSPDGGDTYTTNSRTEYNTYSPQFVMHFSGTTDNSLKRKVQRWVKESVNEVLEDI